MSVRVMAPEIVYLERAVALLQEKVKILEEKVALLGGDKVSYLVPSKFSDTDLYGIEGLDTAHPNPFIYKLEGHSRFRVIGCGGTLSSCASPLRSSQSGRRTTHEPH